MRQVSKDIIISPQSQGLRGSPSPAVVSAGGNLVGRGIANPMSERTRGFEILSSLRCFGVSEREDRTKFPLPALLLFIISMFSVNDGVLQQAARLLLFAARYPFSANSG